MALGALLIVATLGVVATTPKETLAASVPGTSDCQTKMDELVEYYKNNKEGCKDTYTILDRETACSEDDKGLLGDCLKEKKTDWEYVLEHCMGSHMEDNDSDGASEPSDAPAEAPESNTDGSGSDGRRRLLANHPHTCLDKLRDEGLDGFPEVPGYKRSGAMASTISGAMVVAVALVAMFL